MPHQPPLDPSWVDGGCPLRPRQLEVLALVAAGRTRESTARELGISPHTVDRHMAGVLAALGAASAAHAVALAIGLGLLEVDRGAAARHVAGRGRAA